MRTGADPTFYVIRPVHGRASEKSRQFFLRVKSTQLRCSLTSPEKRCAFSRIDFICAEFYGTQPAQQPTPVQNERAKFYFRSYSLSLSLLPFSSLYFHSFLRFFSPLFNQLQPYF